MDTQEAFCVRRIETSDYVWWRNAGCTRNSVLQRMCPAQMFPHCFFWLHRVTCPSSSLHLCVSLSLRAGISVRTRFRGFQGKPSGEPLRSRTCKRNLDITFCDCICVCMHLCVYACTSVTWSVTFTVIANMHSPFVLVHQYLIVLNVMCPPACSIDWHRCSLAATCICVCVCVYVCMQWK